MKSTGLHEAFCRERWRTLACVHALLLSAMMVDAQQFHREAFESDQPKLKLGLTDGQIELLEHKLVTDRIHDGKQAEYLAVRVKSGTFALVDCPIPPSLIFEELDISIHVLANHPGTKLQAQVVLPREIDPGTNKPLVTLVTGATYDTQDRYRKLVLTRIDKLLERQQQMLQNERGKSIDIREAYIDKVVLNVYSGLGDTEIVVDDLVVGPMVPVPDKLRAAESVDGTPSVPITLRGEDGQRTHSMIPEVADRSDLLQATVRNEQLLIGRKAFFPRGLARTHAPLRLLQETGFNIVFEPFPIPRDRLDEASTLGLLVAPMLQQPPEDVANTPVGPPAVFLYLGGPLNSSTAQNTARTIEVLRRSSTDPRPMTGDIEEGFRDYSRQLDMVGTARFPLMTSLELAAYEQWIRERKALAIPGTFVWSWIQTHPPSEVIRMTHGHELDEQPFESPVGLQPEQIKLTSYASLAAGSRGLIYTSDRWLGASAGGKARLLELALLNIELTMIEPFVADGSPPIIRETSHPNIRVAIFNHHAGRGTLAFAYWTKPTTSYVVGQASANGVQFIVPAPEASQVFEVTPIEVKSPKRIRDLGGIRVILDEFDTAAIVVFTPDTNVYAHYQALVQQTSVQAARWRTEFAKESIETLGTVIGRLEKSGHSPKDARSQMEAARKELSEAQEAEKKGDIRTAYMKSRLATRRGRALLELAWQEAVGKNSPISSPFTVSPYSLAEHYEFQDSLKSAAFSENKLVSGDFEINGSLDEAGWSYDPHTIDEVASSASLVSETTSQGKRSLELRVQPKDMREPPLVLDHTRVTATSPSISVGAAQIVRIRGKVRISQPLQATVDGAMIWDDLGGEALAHRFLKTEGWQSFESVRPVRESGSFRLHLCLTGMGAVEFDDIRVDVADANAPIADRRSP